MLSSRAANIIKFWAVRENVQKVSEVRKDPRSPVKETLKLWVSKYFPRWGDKEKDEK